MDRAGILASLCFPTLTRFCGQLFMEASDREFGFTCLQAYNDWMVEEWCGAAPGRYIPLMLIPMWDPQLAVKEMQRMAAKGVTTFAFSEKPSKLGTADDSRHGPLLGPGHRRGQRARAWSPRCTSVRRRNVPKIANDAPFMANLAWGAIRTSGTMLSWLFSGHFTALPQPEDRPVRRARSAGCRTSSSAPSRSSTSSATGSRAGHGSWITPAPTTSTWTPSTSGRLFRDHVYGCFIDDHHGIASIDEIGEDNIMCETDYPHSDSTWPNCIDVVKKQIDHLSPEVQYKLLRGNAERLYRFTPAEPPVLANA